MYFSHRQSSLGDLSAHFEQKRYVASLEVVVFSQKVFKRRFFFEIKNIEGGATLSFLV